MRIEVDGSPIQRPSFAHEVPTKLYSTYLDNSIQLQSERYPGSFHAPKELDRGVIERIATDPNFDAYLASFVRNGEAREIPKFASAIANRLPEGQYLELVYPQRDKDSDKPLPNLGSYLEKGMIVARGEIGEVHSLKGGTLYVDGSVKKINWSKGVIYVTGAIDEVETSNDAIIIAGGKIGSYKLGVSNDAGRLGDTIPPFVFSSEPVEIIKPNQIYHIGRRKSQVPQEFSATITETNIVAKERLQNWLPEATRSQALELAKERVGNRFNELLKLAEEIDNPSEIADFWKVHMEGVYKGYSMGYSDAPKHGSWD